MKIPPAPIKSPVRLTGESLFFEVSQPWVAWFNGIVEQINEGGVAEVSFHAQLAAEAIDKSFFVANRIWEVIGARFVHSTAETTAATLYVQVVKDTGTAVPGAGTNLLTNNTNNGFDCKAAANTVQVGTLTATRASLIMAAGDRLSVDFSAAATELAGVTITVLLRQYTP